MVSGQLIYGRLGHSGCFEPLNAAAASQRLLPDNSWPYCIRIDDVLARKCPKESSGGDRSGHWKRSSPNLRRYGRPPICRRLCEGDVAVLDSRAAWYILLQNFWLLHSLADAIQLLQAYHIAQCRMIAIRTMISLQVRRPSRLFIMDTYPLTRINRTCEHLV